MSNNIVICPKCKRRLSEVAVTTDANRPYPEPLTAEQVKELLALAWARLNEPLWKARQDFAEALNAAMAERLAQAQREAVAQARVDEAKLMRDEYVGGWCDRKAAEKHFADLERDLAAIVTATEAQHYRFECQLCGEMVSAEFKGIHERTMHAKSNIVCTFIERAAIAKKETDNG